MIYSRDDETIIAQCTPRGSGALALIRLSGVNAFSIAQSILKLSGDRSISECASHTIQLGFVTDAKGKNIDQVMILVMRAPKTFTGQDTIEITCHGNQLIVETIIALAIQAGARLAGPGEFSQRAFINKKIDLLQAEAINDLITAQTQTALQKSLAQLEGTFSHWVHDIEENLIKALAWCEASFEFLDEESEFGAEVRAHLQELMKTIEQLKRSYDMQQQVRQGVRIAFIGLVNAGKSSLFNALLGSKRAIVSDIPGTTRDTIEAGITHQGNHWTVIDTAGIRQAKDTIEQEGIQRSHEEAHKADIVVLCIENNDLNFCHAALRYARLSGHGECPAKLEAKTDVSNHDIKTIYSDIINKYGHKIIVAYTKTDTNAKSSSAIELKSDIPVIHTSSAKHFGIEELRNAIAAKAGALLAAHQSPFLLNARHYNLLLGLEAQIQKIIGMLQTPTIHYELVSFHIRQALENLTELTGKSISEAALDKVFKDFCVGK